MSTSDRGSQSNFTALEIPYETITACFVTHLHADHVGDFPNLWVGGWAGGRLKPLEIRGPAGGEPRFGLKHRVETEGSSRARDRMTRTGLLPAAGAVVEAHAFDHATPATVYDRNGVVMRAFPAVHIADGPISYRLEWNGLTFVFSGDTTPSRLVVEHGQGADLLIHECFNTAAQLMARSGYDIRTAIGIGSIAHTRPEDAGRMLAPLNPCPAVLCHHRDEFDKAREILDRMAVEPETVWPNKEKRDAV